AGLRNEGSRFLPIGSRQPRARGIVQMRRTVVTEADPVSELTLEPMITGGVFNDAGALPDADEPAQRCEVGGKVGGQFEHGSALATERIAQDDACDEDDRETRKAEQTDEEEFEGDEVHASSLPLPHAGGV